MTIKDMKALNKVFEELKREVLGLTSKHTEAEMLVLRHKEKVIDIIIKEENE